MSDTESDDEFYADRNEHVRADSGQLDEVSLQKNVSWRSELVEVRVFKSDNTDPELVSTHR